MTVRKLASPTTVGDNMIQNCKLLRANLNDSKCIYYIYTVCISGNVSECLNVSVSFNSSGSGHDIYTEWLRPDK